MADQDSNNENDVTGDALGITFGATQRARKLVDDQASPAEIEHAIATAERIITDGRMAIEEDPHITPERREQALQCMDGSAAEMTALRSPAWTH